jgi:L-methionine (R)-S-oxide reductase
MFELSASADWSDIIPQARALLAGETDAVANAANLSALLFNTLPDVNWVGFYFMKDGGLVVGPFQGKPACVRIALGQGVCGTAAIRRETIVVDDVHAFPGHIACDAASNSEIVIPLLRRGVVLGVLDLDSPRYARFGEGDREGLEAIAALYVEASAEA